MKNSRLLLSILLTAALLFVMTACSGGGGGGDRTTLTTISSPEASGANVYNGAASTMDASNVNKGYVMVKYTGGADRAQVQVTNPDGTRNPYPLELGDYKTIPLTGGDGSYTVEILAHASGDLYSVDLSQSISVALEDPNSPYIYPNQYSQYTDDSECVKKGRELSDKSSDDIDYITKVYDYVTDSIEYDYDFADNIPVNYIPHPDETMSEGKGICLNYASLMTAMLRSQGIPTKLEVGYSGEAYHAWISVYLKDKGWVDDVIEFAGDSWTLMDPTLAASNDKDAAAEYMGDGENYTLKYNY